ncbi:hypothetical protein EIN_065920 [Entamoeba invadens IP1]|uniref:Uncharacterized protein n=1 Tax=Entamoeba invadens IP1 TaxID=370355 RepID=A0A0A1TVC0_ENTIV|nr:hypothetical protein EIN_065920 [Entamoeba invadens IP1]ELP84307.1 hypothetical protein EIN_065920 [Entamoeba invadens IP1]|eukprot:XP_004183653.1 hypothetical protein EIN_065920 [Entamoeba invadens IP1]
MFHCFLSDINPHIREVAAQVAPQILVPTLQVLYRLNTAASINKYATSSLTATGVLRVSQSIALSYIIQSASLPTKSHFLSECCIPRSPNPLQQFEVSIASDLLTLVPFILSQSFDKLPPLIQISGLHAFVRSLRYLCRTPNSEEVPKVVKRCYNYLLEIIRVVLTVHHPESVVPYKYTLPIELLAREMCVINARSDGIDNPVISLSEEAFFAVAVLMRRIRPEKEIFSLFRLFLDEHPIPIHLGIREIIRFGLKPYTKSDYEILDVLSLEADAVHDFKVPEKCIEVWADVAGLTSSVMKLVDNDALRNVESAVVSRCALSIVLAGIKFGIPVVTTKGMFSVDNEEDYIPSDFKGLYSMLMTGVEDDTKRYSKMSPKPQYITHFAVLPPLEVERIGEVERKGEKSSESDTIRLSKSPMKQKTTKQAIESSEELLLERRGLEKIIMMMEEIKKFVTQGVRMSDHFLTLLYVIKFARKTFATLIEYTPSYIDNYLESIDIKGTAVAHQKSGESGLELLGHLVFDIADYPNSDKALCLITKLQKMLIGFSICFDVLLNSLKGDGVLRKLRGEVVIPLYFSAIMQNFVKTDKDLTAEFIYRVEDLDVEDALMIARCSCPLLKVKVAEEQLKNTRPDIARALHGETPSMTPIFKEFEGIESTLMELSKQKELSFAFFHSLFETFNMCLPMRLIEALSYSCLNKKNNMYVERVIDESLPEDYAQKVDVLSQFLPKTQPSLSLVQTTTSKDFWEVQHYFERRLPALRDTARQECFNGQLMLYITKRHPRDILMYLHHQFLDRFTTMIPTNHVLFGVDFKKILMDRLWENQTPPVNSTQSALKALVSMQNTLPISLQLKEEFIENLFRGGENELVVSCLLTHKSYMTFGLDNSITSNVTHSKPYLEEYVFTFTKKYLLNDIQKLFLKDPLKYIRIVVPCLAQFRPRQLYEIYRRTLTVECARSDYLLLMYTQATCATVLLIAPEYNIITPPLSIITLISFHHELIFVVNALLADEATRQMTLTTIQKLSQRVLGCERVVDGITKKADSWEKNLVLRFLWDLLSISTEIPKLDNIIVEDVFGCVVDKPIIDRRDQLLVSLIQIL